MILYWTYKFKIIQNSTFKVQYSKFKVQNSKFRIQWSNFKDQNSNLKVQNSTSKIYIPSMMSVILSQGVMTKNITSNLLQFDDNLAHKFGLSVSLPEYSPATGQAGK